MQKEEGGTKISRNRKQEKKIQEIGLSALENWVVGEHRWCTGCVLATGALSGLTRRVYVSCKLDVRVLVFSSGEPCLHSFLRPTLFASVLEQYSPNEGLLMDKVIC
ncbi:hypothetical protein BDA99DRAFT_567284 [Phascolomyces articulosus]|uniref:Uncharacterized protein n=1 Tax=Phascolomyces articulosus TaxID=60185 RepID=A0AAD5KCS3_9FUNG|nr:hypothetical protein BDA99DRAFT_567284 [Phascolomyces articulosus]